MKKRTLRLASALLLLLCLVPLLSGCGKKQVHDLPDGDFLLTVTIDCPDPVYRVVMEYSSAGEFLGGQSMEHADGTAITDKTANFRFSPEELPPDWDDTRELSFQIALEPNRGSGFDVEQVLTDTGMGVTPYTDPIYPKWGTEYHCTVSGGFSDGFTISEVEAAD